MRKKETSSIEKHGRVAWGHALDGPCALRPIPSLWENTPMGASRVSIKVKDATYVYNTHQPMHSTFSCFILQLQKAAPCEAFGKERGSLEGVDPRMIHHIDRGNLKTGRCCA